MNGEGHIELVRVAWVDSLILNEGGWIDYGESQGYRVKDLQHQTVGRLVADDHQMLAIAQSWNDSAEASSRLSGVVVIPRAAVLNVKRLEERNPGV